MNGRFWLCLPAVICCAADAFLTLLGQDGDYWAGELTRVNELNPLGYYLLCWHPLAFVAGIFGWMAVFCVALRFLPLRAAVVCGLGLAVGHTFGAATWLVRWDGPYVIGMIGGIALLLTADQLIWACWLRFRHQHGHTRGSISMKEELATLFTYDAWANREIALALAGHPSAPPRALQLLAHIVAAQRIWWGRIHHDPTPSPVWPELGLDECQVALAELGQHWRGLLVQLPPDGFAQQVTYSNSAGEKWTSRIEEILRHVIVHGSYHRGQIATYLHQAGFQAPNTDYINAARRGFLDSSTSAPTRHDG
jgi:uncharacterized damage-inducible protein DinB